MKTILLPAVEQALNSIGATYKVLECDPTLADTAAFCRTYGFDAGQSANTIIISSRTDPVQYVCCVVLATTKLDVNKKLRHVTGIRKLSFAPMDSALELTGMEYGGVTAFGVPASVPVYVDAAVMQQAEVVMGGGNRSSKLIINPQMLRLIPGMQVIDDLAVPLT